MGGEVGVGGMVFVAIRTTVPAGWYTSFWVLGVGRGGWALGEGAGRRRRVLGVGVGSWA